MSDLSEPRPQHLQLLVSVQHNTTKLLPLLNLLETPEGPDRIAQLMEILSLVLDGQRQQAQAFRTLLDKVDRLSRR